jgi:serine protease Do
MNTTPPDDTTRELAAVEAEEVTAKRSPDAKEPPVASRSATRQDEHRLGHAFSLIFLCFVASFLGAWAYINFGLIKGPAATTITESRQKLVQEGEVVADVATNVSPSVVSILTESTAQTVFGTQSTQEGAGTGVIISKDGYILTNRHVIPEGTSTVEVVTSDGTVYENVTVVGRDPINDLAFLKIENASNLKAASLGDSGDIAVGQKVVAIGNALGQYQNTVTSGIISALGRPLTASDGSSAESLENLLQTDAAINPGNSGGPLVDLEGKVIGINTAVAADAQGIGFAIPINDAKGLIKSVLNTGKVTRSYLGVRYTSITPEVVKQLELKVDNGAYINGRSGANPVVPGSPAEKAGLKSGDIIVKVNDISIDHTHPLASVLGSFAPGDSVTLTVNRDGKVIQLKATLEEYRS